MQVQHRAFYAIAGPDCNHAPAGRVGIVGGPQQARLAGEVIEQLALVPNVIAGSEDIEAQSEKFFGDRRRDTEASGGVFGIGDGQIDAIGLNDVLQVIGDNAAARGSKDIPNKENVHSVFSR